MLRITRWYENESVPYCFKRKHSSPIGKGPRPCFDNRMASMQMGLFNFTALNESEAESAKRHVNPIPGGISPSYSGGMANLPPPNFSMK